MATAKDLMLMAKILPTLDEPWKSMLYRIAEVPETFYDQPFNREHQKYLLDWILKNESLSRVKLFFDVLYEISQASIPEKEPVVATSKSRMPENGNTCQIAIGGECLDMKRCDKASYIRFTSGDYACCEHYKAIIDNNPKTSEGFASVTCTTPSCRYALQPNFLPLDSFKEFFCCQVVHKDGTICTNRAERRHTYGGLICGHHRQEVGTTFGKQWTLPRCAKTIPWSASNSAIVERKPCCQMAVGDNLLALTRCTKPGSRDRNNQKDLYEICGYHVKEIVENNKYENGSYVINATTPVKLYQPEMTITELDETERQRWFCEVTITNGLSVKTGRYCNSVATRKTIYGNVLCAGHAECVRSGRKDGFIIARHSTKDPWSPSSSVKDTMEAVGPNVKP